MRWWLLTGAMPLLAIAIVLDVWPDATWLKTAVRGYPLALFGATILLAWRFERSRLAWAAVLTGLVWLVLARLDGAAWARVVGPTTVLVPVAVGLLALDDDRPLGSTRALIQLVLLIGATSTLVALIAAPFPSLEAPLAFLRVVVDGSGGVGPASGSFLPVSASSLYAFLCAAALLIAIVVHRRHPADVGLLLLLPALFGMIAARDDGTARAAWALGAGAVLALAAIESAVALAFRDELTGLPSRRALGTALRGLREPYAVAVADIDRFKRVNDTYGHETGDQVLRMVAAHLARVRDGRVFRSGGEEFTMVFAGLDTIEAYHRVDEVRQAIEADGFRLRASDRPKHDAKGARSRGRQTNDGTIARPGILEVTISAGVADARDGGGDPEVAIGVADRALYAAKRNGRNRVIAAGRRRVPAA